MPSTQNTKNMPLCEHMAEWKQERGGRLAYRPLQKSFLAQGGNMVQLCSSCVCLHCAAAQSSFSKLQECHSDAGQHDHVAACDTRRRELYCFACNDYNYDADFDNAMLGVSAVKLNVPGAKNEVKSEPIGTKTGNGVTGRTASLTPERKLRAMNKGHSFPYGLRGLSNLGNTCFMNSVLQAMVHAPLLRNFYLSGGHARSQCKHSLEQPCLSCELDGIFSASYSGTTQPFSPAAFLHAWWRHADHHLASYQQQDAHEFYLYALAGLGQSWPEEKAAPASAPVSATSHQQQLSGMKQDADMASHSAPQLQRQQELEIKQEAGVASHAAEQQYQLQQPPKQEPKEEECLLVPPQHALHACLAEPLHQGVNSNGLHGSHAQSSPMPDMHSNGPLPSRLTNGVPHQSYAEPTPASSQAAMLYHNMAAASPFVKGNSRQHHTSAPQQQASQQSGMGHLPHVGQAQPQAVMSSISSQGGYSLPGNGLKQATPSLNPQSDRPSMQQPSGQQQNHAQGQQMQSNVQHSSAFPHSRAPQQQHPASISQHVQHQGQQSQINSLHPGMPQHAMSNLPCQTLSQQLSVPQIKQEGSVPQQHYSSLPQYGAWPLQQQHRTMQQGQMLYQHVQSVGGGQSSGPQRQQSSHSPSSLSIPQTGALQHSLSHPSSLPMPRDRLSSNPVRPLTMQEQLLAFQQDSLRMTSGPHPEPLQNDSIPEPAKSEAPTRPGAQETEGIVQRIFGGVLQSEVICSACCHISTAYDPFLDISLDIGAPPLPPPPMLKPPSNGNNRPSGGPKRLSGAAAMAVAAAQKRAAVSAPAEVSASGTPEPQVPTASAPLQQMPRGSRLGADALDRSARSEVERVSLDTDAASIIGEALSQRALSDNNESVDKSGSQNVEEAARYWQGTPAPEEPLTRRGSTDADVPEYRASPTQASERDFASTTRGPLCSEGASSGIVGNSQDVDEAMSTPTARLKQRPTSSEAGRGRPTSSGGKRPSRCMQCATCLKPQLKKACLRNKALRSMGSLDRLPSLDRMPSLDAISIEAPPPEPSSRPSPSPEAASTPSKASAQRMRSDEDCLEPSSRSPSLTFPTRASLPQPETPHGIPMTPLSANGNAQQPQQGAPGKLPKLPGSVSLLGCLQRFVRPERLGSSQHWVCGACARPQHAVKQMSVHRLPPVLCLHVKRFEHTGVGKKLYTPLDFTAYLDMRPYLSSSIMHARIGSQGLQGRGALHAALPQRAQQDADPCMYELYTVVCHRGNLQGGHYVSYVKCKDAWYLCDDSAVFQVDELTACCPSAYMLFYRQLAVQS